MLQARGSAARYQAFLEFAVTQLTEVVGPGLFLESAAYAYLKQTGNEDVQRHVLKQ